MCYHVDSCARTYAFSIYFCKGGFKILKGNFKNKIVYVLLFTFVLNIIGLVNTPIDANAASRPKLTGVELVDKNSTVGTYPTLKLSSGGAESVQYSVYLYSPSKRAWENVSNGYTSAVSGNNPYTIKLRKPLHKGENNFSVWVKKSYASAVNKGGYDDFKSFKIDTDSEVISQPDYESESGGVPSIKSVNIDLSQQKIGIKPIMNITSTGDEKVEYKVLYSNDKNQWEDVSNGYSLPQEPSNTYSVQLNTPLIEGENSFKVLVKRSDKEPSNKEGYDNFLNYKVNIEKEAPKIPKITKVDIDNSEVKLGKKPTLRIKSDADSNVQYRVYLYSQSKEVWEDVSNGYTRALDPNDATIQINGPLQSGRNNFSIWVKREGYSPSNVGGYDSFVNKVVNVYNINEVKISDVKVNTATTTIGRNPEITVSGVSGDGSDISYKAFLYSNSKGKWTDASSYTNGVKSGQCTEITLDTPIESGTNKVLVWAKRVSVSGEVYEDFKKIDIDAVRPGPMKKRIVIDPGHGGKDPGAVDATTGIREKEIALTVGLKLGTLLSNRGYDVLYTRTDNNRVAWNSSDQNQSLKYRYTFANSNGANLFVSIHCNKANGSGYGTETLYSKKYPSKDKALASAIQSEVIKITGMRNRGIKNNYNWAVVNNTKMPASLVELGFVDNIGDSAKLKDALYQDKFAQGIFNGITRYLNK
ncbi:N-acetylmuramoyl-L-alanine amidase [Clostridium cylindrosporum]|uniref:Sporulation-specific N-acetylmuramoyl-L-alanine amidase CwlC n=1 Tax=Clostridium cylindrosporum DSM 605 TaxID=1121307 RepID=A0A0J8DE95_CLOCY|nr:N-acetylmuramoyl-L-alanine amidase [Clostridium cylindrosporum]KMT22508.1 sporulation-specific N-acetylmuramoyl-L-alanine amidase CwlC [Clostridium cylindrosporum DSM 605]